ncbi:MAG: hypothetical protein COY40_02840 [Alphaproteobacteria bacterium CG_4_10_14_0_8_um_filter_53_9]|nr:MAG: hypothetical protein COY40_02840 [Alphaproteobacteria bacterium CG_4_10_14_0_8_um_filter_53_9]
MKAAVLALMMPLGLAMVLVAAGLWKAWQDQRRVKGFMGFFVAAFLLLYINGTPAFLSLLSRPLLAGIDGPSPRAPSDVDAILVLTGGMYPSGGLGWMPMQESYQRLAVGYELQRMMGLRIPVIVSGGHTAGVEAPSEARVVADFFARHRSELTPTELEEVSTDTYESALQLAPVLMKRNADTVLLVTRDIHMLRALAAYRARGIDAVPAPSLSLPDSKGFSALVPRAKVFSDVTDVWYEYVGLAYYLVSGRIAWRDLFYRASADAAPAMETGDVIYVQPSKEVF